MGDGTDPARRESLQQAVSLAIVTPGDLLTAARPALRTAKLLYELAQRGAVAEALAARRAARASAAASARGAAQAARDAAGRAVERSLIQAAAAAGIVLSNAGDLIARSPAMVLLGLIALVALGSMTIALRVEQPSAQGGLESELADLTQFRDALSLDEIGDVANASAIRSAQADLKRAKLTVIIVYIVVVTATLGLGGTFVLARSDEANAPGTREQTPGAPASASSSAGPVGGLPYDATNVLVVTSEVGEKEDSIHQSSGQASHGRADEASGQTSSDAIGGGREHSLRRG
jgi:hypothetical protein